MTLPFSTRNNTHSHFRDIPHEVMQQMVKWEWLTKSESINYCPEFFDDPFFTRFELIGEKWNKWVGENCKSMEPAYWTNETADRRLNDGKTRLGESYLPRIIDSQQIRDSQMHPLEADGNKHQIDYFLPKIACEIRDFCSGEPYFCAYSGAFPTRETWQAHLSHQILTTTIITKTETQN